MGFVATMHEGIVTTNLDRSVLFTIITWHFQFHLVNISILHQIYKYRAQHESRFVLETRAVSLATPIVTSRVAP